MAKPKVGPDSPAGTVKVGDEAKFPTNTKGRARAALARLNQGKGLSTAQKRKVVSSAYKRLGIPPDERNVKVGGK